MTFYQYYGKFLSFKNLLNLQKTFERRKFIFIYSHMDYRIKEILVKIDNDFSRTLDIKQLADSVNMSISRFQHLFKQEVNISLTQYIKELRLQKAREFLETTHLRIKEIRVRVGDLGATHFWSDFKRKFGKTPNQFRKNFRNSRNSQ